MRAGRRLADAFRRRYLPSLARRPRYRRIRDLGRRRATRNRETRARK